MGKIADALKKLIENSDDLSTLPLLVAQVETIEASEENYQTRIAKLQEINKSYLAQIPIPTDKTNEPPEEPDEPTIADAKQYLIEALGGNK
jgi:hypothetical protein